MNNLDDFNNNNDLQALTLDHFQNILMGRKVNDYLSPDSSEVQLDIENVIGTFPITDCCNMLIEISKMMGIADGVINVDTEQNIKAKFSADLRAFFNTLPNAEARSNMTSGVRIALRIIRDLSIKSFTGIARRPDLMPIGKEDLIKKVNGILQEFLQIEPIKTVAACQAICEYTGEASPKLSAEIALEFLSSAKQDLLFSKRIEKLLNDQAFSSFWKSLHGYKIFL
ncbi:hypothetical protein KC678_00615 [Candidatus Dojkabacteria bacterium]|uniref:Uncharacterized protein n=1 Tax=Candidatus Dojkabacteria bacterium TaxID=2099670 RepID=A0A955I8T7_9BACT|nr:hypothetical protein [Candidatus Dojkabacteria bacterium]